MLHHFPVRVRAGVAALWTIDEAMAAVVAGASQPALAAIKLAWWREALARLDHDPAPPEPRLRAVAEAVLPLGISGDDVSGIGQGWSALLDAGPDPSAVATGGTILFELEARMLGIDEPLLREAGALAFISTAMRRKLGDFSSYRHDLLASFRGRRVSRAARPITLAARLAARDLAEAEGTPGRALALIAHRLTGVIVRG